MAALCTAYSPRVNGKLIVSLRMLTDPDTFRLKRCKTERPMWILRD
jgi:hypothetical protein